ncbi:MAG: cytochrome o ubiquinol oxidase subunit IV [Rhodanobacter sp.]
MSHSHSHDHAAHGHGEQPSHGSLRSYLTGFVLASILTVIPFWLVMGHVFQSHWLTITLVLLLAVVQILVHVIYFLHLDTRSEGGWNMLSFVFTIVLVVIVLGASIWVMYNENSLMMPMSQQSHQGT